MSQQFVNPKKSKQLKAEMKRLGLLEQDLEEKFILGAGKGGQKINKTSAAVYLKHLPTGLKIKCQQKRSRELNRFLARRKLCEKFSEIILGKKSERQSRLEKIKRQKQRRQRRGKPNLLKKQGE